MEIGPTAQDLSCPAHLADHSWPYGGPEGRPIENTPLDFIFSNIYYAWFWWSAKNVSWQCIKHVNQQLCMCMYFSHGDDVIALLSSFAYHSSLDCGCYTNICAERLWIPSNDVLSATINYSANFPEFPFNVWTWPFFVVGYFIDGFPHHILVLGYFGYLFGIIVIERFFCFFSSCFR